MHLFFQARLEKQNNDLGGLPPFLIKLKKGNKIGLTPFVNNMPTLGWLGVSFVWECA